MENRVTTVTERALTSSVNDTEHMESQSMNGVGVIAHMLLMTSP